MKNLLTLTALLLSLSPVAALAGALDGAKIQCEGLGQRYLLSLGEEHEHERSWVHEYPALVSGYRLYQPATARAERIATRTMAGYKVSVGLGHGTSLVVQKLVYSIFPQQPVGVSGALVQDKKVVAKLDCAFLTEAPESIGL